MRLDGQCALITGGGSGIGRALAVECVARGMRVALVGRRAEPLEETCTMLAEPGRGHILVADIADRDDRARLRPWVRELFGSLNVLINNAGVQTVGALAEMSDENLEAMIRTNLTAPIALSRDLRPLLVAGAPSRIVNIGSVFGDIAFPLYSVYSATKFGLRGLSDALRRELRDDGIGVTYAAPRATVTPTLERSRDLVAPFAMTLDRPEAVARRILDAVERDARSVYPRGPERFFVLIQRLFPGLIDSQVAGQLRAAREVLLSSSAGSGP